MAAGLLCIKFSSGDNFKVGIDRDDGEGGGKLNSLQSLKQMMLYEI